MLADPWPWVLLIDAVLMGCCVVPMAFYQTYLGCANQTGDEQVWFGTGAGRSGNIHVHRVSLSLTRTHSHARAHTHTRTHTHTHTRTHIHKHTRGRHTLTHLVARAVPCQQWRHRCPSVTALARDAGDWTARMRSAGVRGGAAVSVCRGVCAARACCRSSAALVGAACGMLGASWNQRVRRLLHFRRACASCAP